MQSRLRNHIFNYFSAVAKSYAEAIEPAFSPLAFKLVEYANLSRNDVVLDMGTGTGLAARFARQITSNIVAFDFSPIMLAAAANHQSLDYLQADIHRLPFRPDSFDVALAAFVFNSTDPKSSFLETKRVLKLGGRLIMHEWGTEDHLSALLADTIVEYAVETPSSELGEIRCATDIPLPWDDLEDMDSLCDELVSCGFDVVSAQVISPVVIFESVQQFMQYKFAWPTRKAEIDAMSSEVVKLCLSDLEENLSAHTNVDGTLNWEPNVVRLSAIKPA